MKKLKTIILLILLVSSVHAQIVTVVDTSYVFVNKSVDSSDMYLLNPGQKIVTNTLDVLGIAPLPVTAENVLSVIDQVKVKLDELPDSGQVKRHDLYTYQGEVCKIVQSHNRSTVNHYNPHDVPALYLFRELGCPEWVQPTGGHDAYNIDDCITFNGVEYLSNINANVWSPNVYPAGWRLK